MVYWEWINITNYIIHKHKLISFRFYICHKLIHSLEAHKTPGVCKNFGTYAIKHMRKFFCKVSFYWSDYRSIIFHIVGWYLQNMDACFITFFIILIAFDVNIIFHICFSICLRYMCDHVSHLNNVLFLW